MRIADSNIKIKFADIFLLFSLFPYVSFNITSFDTQPFTFLLGLIGLYFSQLGFHLNKIFKISLVLVLIALFISAFSVIGGNYHVIRGMYNYLSIFFYLFVFSYLFRNNLINNKLIIFANYTYLFFAFVQIYFPQIINIIIVSRVNNSFYMGRGLSSLTPEPSHFGIILILISMLLFINSGYDFKKNIFLYLINLLAIFSLVRNAALILILFVSFILAGLLNINYLLRLKYLRNLIILSLPLSFGIFYSIAYKTRIFRILDSIKFDDLQKTLIILINTDLSISERLQHLIIPFIALYKDLGMPHAFNGLEEYAASLGTELSIFAKVTNSKIFMSFMGDYVFSLGIFGLIAAFLIFIPLIKKKYVPNYILILFVTLLTTSVPVSNPIVPAVIAGLYYKNNELNQNCKM